MSETGHGRDGCIQLQSCGDSYPVPDSFYPSSYSENYDNNDTPNASGNRSKNIVSQF